MRTPLVIVVAVGVFSCESGAAQGTRGPDPVASQLRRPISLVIRSFSHSPHGSDGELDATEASARLIDRQLLVEGVGPRSKEGAFFELRLGIPMASLVESGTVPARDLTLVYHHGGEAGLRFLDAEELAGRVVVRRDDDAGSVVGEFDLVLSLPRIDPEYGIARQRLVGTFEARRCRDWFDVIQLRRRVAITRADLAYVLLAQGRRGRVVAAKRLPDGMWLVELQGAGRELTESVILDQYGGLRPPVPGARKPNSQKVLRRRSY